MPAVQPFPWAEYADTALRLWKEGQSAAQVARELYRLSGIAVTRSAVIGKVSRMGYSRPAPTNAATSKLRGISVRVRQTRPRAMPAAKTIIAGAQARQKFERHAKPAPPVVDATHAKLWTERKFGECAYPISGEGAETFSCCLPTHGATYCPGHWERMTSKELTAAQRAHLAEMRRKKRMTAPGYRRAA